MWPCQMGHSCHESIHQAHPKIMFPVPTNPIQNPSYFGKLLCRPGGRAEVIRLHLNLPAVVLLSLRCFIGRWSDETVTSFSWDFNSNSANAILQNRESQSNTLPRLSELGSSTCQVTQAGLGDEIVLTGKTNFNSPVGRKKSFL